MVTTHDTKTRLLEVAERLFAQHGFAETSIRNLTQEAGANLAAVHYHFGSKERLFQATIERVLEPVNAERLRNLDDLEARDPSPSAREVVLAFLGPVLRAGARQDQDATRLVQLMGRINVTTGSYAQQLREVFAEVEARFVPALRRALPQLAPETLFWRLNFMLAVMCMTLFDPQRIRLVSNGLCEPADTDNTLRQMTAFVTAGLEAPDSGPTAEGPAP